MGTDDGRAFRESERRLIQKELFLLEDQKDEAEQRFRAMFENALVGLFRGNVPSRLLTDANLEAARLFGCSNVEELIWWVNREFDAFSFFNGIPDPHSLDPGEPHSFSARSLRRDGTEFWAQFSVRYSADGRWLEGAVKDITDQVESMDRLRQAKGEAEEANEAKSRFLATMSHEIRTPLYGIIGFAEILQERNDPKSREYSRKILDESDRLMILISQLLDFSKLEANKITLETIPLDLYELLDEIDAGFARTVQISGLEYRRHIGEDVPARYIGDPMRLRQVITNLISNALKFTLEGSVVFRVDRVGNESGSPLLRFSIRDTGIGIAEDQQESIFASFVQADSSISRRYGGTGLGISICRELVNLMGGRLELESEVGSGSEFYFTIPLATPDDSSEWNFAYRENPIHRIGLLKSKKVLLVEDYDTNREIARHHLEKSGCLVSFAKDGREAVDMLGKGETPDLIFMDMHMPRMDGLEATETLRAMGVSTPIIGMTASAYAEDRIKCLDSGMDDFLTKPLRRATLLAKAIDWASTGSLAHRTTDRTRDDDPGTLSGDSPLRYNEFIEELDGEADLARELLDGFTEDSRKRLERAESALADNDYELLHREFHSIKGGALNVMADELAVRSFDAEKAAGAGTDTSLMGAELKKVHQAFERFVAVWKGLRTIHDTNERQPGPL